MTYNLIEISEYDGEPVELYTFNRSSDVFRYTSADEDKTFGGFVFTSIPLKRGKLLQDLESAKQSVTLESTKDLGVVQTYRSSPSSNVTTLKIQRYHEGDTDAVTIWLGRIVNVKFGERDCKIRCDPFFTSLKRPVLRLRYQTNCPHVLYGSACGVLRASFAAPASLLGANGIQLIASAFGAFSDGYLTGGYIEWDNSGINERRFILSHTGNEVIIDLPFEGLPGNASVTAYPGCDHTLTTCNTKFNNEDNYGGQPFYPERNPFDGAPIF